MAIRFLAVLVGATALGLYAVQLVLGETHDRALERALLFGGVIAVSKFVAFMWNQSRDDARGD